MALVCGHEPSPHHPITTGTAHLPDGREVCCDCADAWRGVDYLYDDTRGSLSRETTDDAIDALIANLQRDLSL